MSIFVGALLPSKVKANGRCVTDFQIKNYPAVVSCLSRELGFSPFASFSYTAPRSLCVGLALAGAFAELRYMFSILSTNILCLWIFALLPKNAMY